jgi:hypothetical protein
MSMNLFSESIQLMKELLRKSKKVKRGATLEEAEINGAWLTAYARIARKCRTIWIWASAATRMN